jgi:hypothetical protein
MSNKIPESRINEIMEQSDYEVIDSKHGSCTVVIMTMPNGFTLVESSGCIDPKEYDHDLGVELCKAALKRKVWQLEGYLGKQAFYEETQEC